jgi:hypothetical protein
MKMFWIYTKTGYFAMARALAKEPDLINKFIYKESV